MTYTTIKALEENPPTSFVGFLFETLLMELEGLYIREFSMNPTVVLVLWP